MKFVKSSFGEAPFKKEAIDPFYYSFHIKIITVVTKLIIMSMDNRDPQAILKASGYKGGS